MKYCPNCMTLPEEDKCPDCKTRELREPTGSDPVLLIEKGYVWAGMVEEILSDNGIPLLKKGVRGAGLSVSLGEVGETFRFFVPYETLEQARELMVQLFPADFGEEVEADQADIHD